MRRNFPSTNVSAAEDDGAEPFVVERRPRRRPPDADLRVCCEAEPPCGEAAGCCARFKDVRQRSPTRP